MALGKPSFTKGRPQVLNLKTIAGSERLKLLVPVQESLTPLGGDRTQYFLSHWAF